MKFPRCELIPRAVTRCLAVIDVPACPKGSLENTKKMVDVPSPAVMKAVGSTISASLCETKRRNVAGTRVCGVAIRTRASEAKPESKVREYCTRASTNAMALHYRRAHS